MVPALSADVEFTITTRRGQEATVVTLAGEVDLYCTPQLAEAFRSASVDRLVVVDLREVTFLDSSVLALLVQQHRRLQAAGRELLVRVGEATPMVAFAVTGIDRLLRIERADGAEESPS